MRSISTRVLLASLCTSAVLATRSFAEYSPGVGTEFPKNVYFGDLHLHSRNSADAFSLGNLGLSAADAFRFARGEEVIASNGLPARLRRPLDFLAVTDHSEFLGLFYQYHLKNPVLMDAPLGKRWALLSREEFIRAFVESIDNPDPDGRDKAPEALEHSIWRDVTRTADEYDDPERFTAFSGYEWTSDLDGNNLHRCVIFRDGGEVVSRVLPYSALRSSDPEDLWRALAAYEKETGGSVIAIPHNGNLSNGLMWDAKDFYGKALSKAYAEARMRWEPVAEVTQIKGDSETHPLLSPTDEFAAFERWDRYNIQNSAPTTPEMFPGSHARSALQRGLALASKLGANPYKFGMIGSTDQHTSLSSAAEDNFFGKFANSEPGQRSGNSRMAGMKNADWELGASGIAAIWSRGNTRASLFDAMQRKEVYATTGSRIVLRFFGGWDYAPDSVYSPEFVKIGYAQGVPMGGELHDAPRGRAPTFMIGALRDPDDANLDRVQIIKAWLDAKGDNHEKVFDVALSDDRKVDPATGKAPPVGSTVNLDDASYANTIGAAELLAQWTDPDFDPRQPAFYYARVIEIPKPRWTTYDRRFFGVQYQDAPKTVQDRAYSSPIWYSP